MTILISNLLATLAIESLANQFGVAKLANNKVAWERLLAANLISNPLAQIAFQVFFINLWLIEIVVVLFEAFFYWSKGEPFKQALGTSLFLNTCSVVFGFLLHGLIL